MNTARTNTGKKVSSGSFISLSIRSTYYWLYTGTDRSNITKLHNSDNLRFFIQNFAQSQGSTTCRDIIMFFVCFSYFK
jgi:hypothetical protein